MSTQFCCVCVYDHISEVFLDLSICCLNDMHTYATQTITGTTLIKMCSHILTFVPVIAVVQYFGILWIRCCTIYYEFIIKNKLLLTVLVMDSGNNKRAWEQQKKTTNHFRCQSSTAFAAKKNVRFECRWSKLRTLVDLSHQVIVIVSFLFGVQHWRVQLL